jgi:hypothetical protein
LSTEKPPHNKTTKLSPITGIVPNKLVITVAPHKLICPQTKIYPRKPVAIINKNKTNPVNQVAVFLKVL